MTLHYHNENLFSEIYLEEITQQTESNDILASLDVLGEYRDYADKGNLLAWKESYVHEVLAALGFSAQSKGEHLTLLKQMGEIDIEKPLTLCYIVNFEDNLNSTTIGRNWAEKAIRALRENNLQWGLLTNGKQWRIYHLDEPIPYETYLEIDLEFILKEKAKEAYQIFYKFMKAENFYVKEDGKCQFDRFKKESQDKIDYIEKELANALKQREEGGKGVLSDLCMGYVEELRHRNEENLDDEALRKKIYHGAMLYMFRLLFLYYADARGLLSDENHELLAKVVGECRVRHDSNDSSNPTFPIWESLEHIFVDIDQTYNGGLFSPQENEFTRFLSDTWIGDTYLANVIFNLTIYREKNGQEKQISYRDMSVRHLGTLYEGLLEHKLYIAAEDTEVKIAKGKIQFIPVSKGGKLTVGHYIKAGEVYFAGDPSERKSTGSYYTPEYIVDYIVRNTVGEKLKELKSAFFKEQLAAMEAYKRAVDEDERQALSNLLEEKILAFTREKVLELSVLDPAMGSGHFLVNATNLVSNFITEILNELDITRELESGTGYWRRWVVENCIYGVDINPLAVELAKLSLWILSMVKNQPLSFMNHHLKCGNSLVGAKLDEIGNYPLSTIKKEPHQLHLFDRDPDFKSSVEAVILKSRQISGKASFSLDDVREKKVWLEEIDQILDCYKIICDVHTNLYFENSLEESQYNRMVQKKDINIARFAAIYKYYSCFHWELEYPMIFFSKSGFDCVVGNPPYIDSRSMVRNEQDDLRRFIVNTYKYAKGSWDIYIAFLEAGLNLSKFDGLLAFVTPDKWLAKSFGEEFRKRTIGYLRTIFLLGHNAFENATVDAIVPSFSKCRTNYLIFEKMKDGRLEVIRRIDKSKIKDATPLDWLSGENLELILKIDNAVGRLQDLAECESSCATNDAYRLKTLISDYNGIDVPDHYMRMINTGTIDKFVSKWGERKMVYLGEKYLRPVVNRHDFVVNFPNTYSRRAQSPKIIIKGLRHLDACLDETGNIIPGIPTLVICGNEIDKLKFISAFINCKLTIFFIKEKYSASTYHEGGIIFTRDMINNLPLPTFTLEIENSVVSIVNQILYAKHKDSKADTTTLVKEIDQIIYDLYGLTNDEIAIIEGKENG